MLLLLMMLMMISMYFFYSSNPLMMCLNLFFMVIMSCMVSGLLGFSYWFSYILFLIYMGALMVLYMYIISLIPNKMFKINMVLIMLSLSVFIYLFLNLFLNLEFFYYLENSLSSNLSCSMMKMDYLMSVFNLYASESLYIFIFIVIYLLLTLYIVVDLTVMNKGPVSLMK